MLISIITINFNNVAGLKKTMTSVLEQTFSNIEYIVIDGGSTDGSTEYIEANQDSLAYWVSEPDKGIYNAMNKGIEKATGDYILFLNSGDWLVDYQIIEKISNEVEGAEILYGNLIKVFSENQTIIDKGPNGKEITFNTFYKGTLNHPATLIRKDLFDKFGCYDETLKIVSDWKFFLISIGLNNTKVKYVNRAISCFNMSGLSTSNISIRNNERQIVLQKLVPLRILKDYEKSLQRNKIMDNSRINMLLEIEQSNIPKKLNILWLKLLSKLV